MKELNKKDWELLMANLKIIAEEKGITHKVISKNLGVTRERITNILNLKNMPQIDTFWSLAMQIVSIKELFALINKLIEQKIK